MNGEVVLLDSVSALGAHHAGVVVVTGSHGGVAAMRHAAAFAPRALVCHDGGIGRDGAGVAGLAVLAAPAAAVDGRSARIGDSRDLWQRGAISRVNDAAGKLGLRPGMPVVAAVPLLLVAPPPPPGGSASPPALRLTEPRCVVADSISLLTSAHRGWIAVVGSHAAPAAVAIGLPIGLAGCLHHDAGAVEDDGCDAHGIAGLTLWGPVPAAAVSGRTARIGDGEDVLARGVLSAVNAAAASCGLRPGMAARDAVLVLARHHHQQAAGQRPVRKGDEA
jgi:uncharacterized protein YunC (DUF1805 family)